MYGVLYFFVGFLSNLDDIPVLFALEERFDVFDLNVITVLLGSAWATRFIYGLFVDWFVSRVKSYRWLLYAVSISGLVLWILLSTLDNPDNYVFVALLFAGEVNICNLKTIVDAMCADERDEEQMVRAIRFRLYGRLLARTLGASLAWLGTFQAAFVTMAVSYGVLSLLVVMFHMPPGVSEEVPREAKSASNVHLIFLVICLFWAMPTSDRTQDLWYIQVLGYEENNFIYPVLIADLVSVIATIGRNVSLRNVVQYIILCNMVVYATRTVVNCRVLMGFDGILLVLAYSMWGVLEGRVSCSTFLMVANSNRGNSAARLAFYDSLPVLAGGVGYASTLLLLHLYDIRDENYLRISELNFTITAISFVISLLSVFLVKYFV